MGKCDGERIQGGIIQSVSIGSRTVGKDRASGVCSDLTTERPRPPATAGEDLEREMVSSRLLLIARRCASRCNRIPAATHRKGEGTRCASVCVFPYFCVWVGVLQFIYTAAMFRKSLLRRRV